MNKTELIKKVKEVKNRQIFYDTSTPTIEYQYVLDDILPYNWYMFLSNQSNVQGDLYVLAYKIECSYEEMCNIVKLHSPEDLLAWKLYYVLINGIDGEDIDTLKEQSEIYRNFTLAKISALCDKAYYAFDITSDNTLMPDINYRMEMAELRSENDNKDAKIDALEMRVSTLEDAIDKIKNKVSIDD